MVEVTEQQAGQLVLKPFGELCHFELGPLRSALNSAIASHRADIRVDLAAVTLLSSSAVALLTGTARRCEVRGLRLTVVGASDLHRRVLDILGAGALVAVAVAPGEV